MTDTTKGSLAYPYYKHRNAGSQPRTKPATSYQRLEVITLFRALELGDTYITLMHRRHFEAAGIVFPEPGTRVDAVLSVLSIDHASRLIQALRQERESLL
jgi:hypothetical protein